MSCRAARPQARAGGRRVHRPPIPRSPGRERGAASGRASRTSSLGTFSPVRGSCAHSLARASCTSRGTRSQPAMRSSIAASPGHTPSRTSSANSAGSTRPTGACWHIGAGSRGGGYSMWPTRISSRRPSRPCVDCLASWSCLSRPNAWICTSTLLRPVPRARCRWDAGSMEPLWSCGATYKAQLPPPPRASAGCGRCRARRIGAQETLWHVDGAPQTRGKGAVAHRAS